MKRLKLARVFVRVTGFVIPALMLTRWLVLFVNRYAHFMGDLLDR